MRVDGSGITRLFVHRPRERISPFDGADDSEVMWTCLCISWR
jgi:hypothetical protein